MKWRITSCLFMLLFFQSFLQSGQWSKPIDLFKTSQMQFQWRLIGYDTKAKRNNIEFSFNNSSDSTVLFSYLIITDQNERLIGRVFVQPHQKKLAGWPFKGNSIVNTLVENVQFLNLQNQNAASK